MLKFLMVGKEKRQLEKDMMNSKRYKTMGSVKNILMKPDCVPSKFDCQTNTNVHAEKDIPKDAATHCEEHRSLQKEDTQYSNGNFSDEVLYGKEESVKYRVPAENLEISATRGGRSRGRRGRAARAALAGGRGQGPLITGLGERRALANVQAEVLESLPRGQPIESPKEGIRKRKSTRSADIYEECKTSTWPPVPPSPEQTSLGPHRPRASAKTQIAPVINYGSEVEDEEDGDDINNDVRHLTNLSMSSIDREFEGELDMKREEIETVASIVEKDFEATTVEQFHFDWRSMGPSEISGERRSKFVGEIKGRANYHYNTPYDAFTAIWSAKFMEMIVLQTNLYAQQYAESLFRQEKQTVNSRVQHWKDTTVDELYTFIAICLAMGIVVKSNLPSYWLNNSDIFSTPGFAAAMPLRRFQLLNTCLHFVNNNDISAANLDAQQAKIFKIRPVIDHLNAVLPQLYTLGRNLSLDESLTKWKGRLSINQHIRTKIAKRGIKSYEVCESDTGYLWRFEVHTGPVQEQTEYTVLGSTSSLVLRLLSGLENRGHTIWMDNYYNSPSLSRVLKSLGFDCAGTLKLNQKFVPLEISCLSNTSLQRNEIITCTSGDVDVLAWRDKRLVCLTSTYHGNAVAMYRGKLLPIVVRDYNLCMGGVDRKDQLLAMYPMERKRMRSWYKTYFQRLLNASVLNAYILFNRSPTSPTRTSHRQFRLDLIKELLKRHHSLPSPHSFKRPLTQTVRRFPEEFLAHFPEQLPLLSNGKERTRRKCAHCGARTTSICTPCNAPLCTFTCFRPFHQTYGAVQVLRKLYSGAKCSR